MIKKLNTVLVAVFAAMAALKGAKLLTHRGGESAASQAADAERSGGASQLAPHVYYAYWAGYTLQNPVSNRNGILLDMVRAVFPNAEGAPKDGLTAMRFIQNFRKSSVIASDGTLLYVSGLDADFAKKVVEDYESGIRRINRTGELRRICEYYGTPYEPLDAP